MGQTVTSDTDCVDCLCRVYARNVCNDSQNVNIDEKTYTCNCDVFNELIETEEDCESYLPDDDM